MTSPATGPGAPSRRQPPHFEVRNLSHAARLTGDPTDSAPHTTPAAHHTVPAHRAARVGSLHLSRRDVLRSLAGVSALVLGVPLSACAQAALGGSDDDVSGASAPSWQAHLFLAIDGDGQVTLVTHRSEMGTGISTSLPMAMADELGADWSRVRLVQADGDARYGSQNTDGSRSIHQFFEPLRRVAASARVMLEQAAAGRWDVPAAECEAADHRVHHAASGRSVSFGSLVTAAAALVVPDEATLTLRSPSGWRMIGKGGVPTAHFEDMVAGRARYGIDASPGDGPLTAPATPTNARTPARAPDSAQVLIAVIARSPVLGGHPTRWDEDAALAVPGVLRVVRLADASLPPAFAALGGLAVVARDTWSALRGRDALHITWEPGENAAYDSESYAEQLVRATAEPGRVALSRGDVDAALASADRVLEATYELPHLAHASMEPPCALARVTDDGAEIWAPTQNPQAAVSMVAGSLGLPADKVTVHVTLLGGGFGRKSKPDYVVEAALLAREMDVPVKLLWTREDDIRHDYYHACAAVSLRAALDEQGHSAAWLVRSAFPSISSTFRPGVDRGSDGELNQGILDIPFALPHLRCESGKAEAHVRIGWLRSVCNIFHAFAVGCFVDELAAAAGRDPKEHLLELLGPPRTLDPSADGAAYGNYGRSLEEYPLDTGRLAAVVERVTSEAGWGRTLPRGRGQGLAVHRSFLSFVATVVELEVSREGRLTIPRVDVAVDCGLAVNPDRVVAQFEGAAVFGTSLALFGAITAKDGAVEQGNFDDYPIARMAQAPREVHVHLLQSDAPPAGVGEPGVPPFAPALCNALFAATGKRVRRLPLSAHDLSWS